MEAIGGQALIEGVMIKAGNRVGVAVRAPDGKIVSKTTVTNLPFSKIPFIRGVVNLIFLLWIGVKELHYSSSIALPEEEKTESSNIWMGLTIVFSFIFALALFKFLPLLAAEGVSRVSAISYGVYNLVDGFVKIGIFLGYVALLGLMADMRRVFAYHGAEHKVVNCYEAGKELTLKNLAKFSTIHARCGTNFIFLVLLLSILVYTFIPSAYGFWAKLGLRIALLPVIASLSYELLRLAAKFEQFLGLLVLPGKLMQRLTTREPDSDQLAVAIAALRAAVGGK